MFLNADFGRVMFERGRAPHQNRLCFSLLLSFAEAKESRSIVANHLKKLPIVSALLFK
jgi:hypothetical protein